MTESVSSDLIGVSAMTDVSEAFDEIEQLRDALYRIAFASDVPKQWRDFAARAVGLTSGLSSDKSRMTAQQQFHCSNTSNLCDHCGKAMCLHSVGGYYCPQRRC